MRGEVEIVRGHRIDYQLYKYLLQYFSDGDLTRMFEAIRKPPSRYYVRVNTLRVSPEDLVSKLRERGLEVFMDEHLKEAIWLPIKGPNRVPSARKIVIADKRAAESVYMGANLYVPGVVKFEEGINRGDEVNVVAPNGEVVAFGIAELGSDEVGRVSNGVAVRTIVSVYSLPKVREIPEYEMGLFYDQSLPAQWVAHILDPRPGEVIVDMNAAPGGKLSHIIQLTGGRATIYAFDRSPNKVREMNERLGKLGMTGLYRAEVRDSRYLDVDKPELVGSVDKVLIDPPCSDMGVRPRLFDVKTMDLVRSMSEYQKQFIRVAWKLLKPGGVLVYSTCTIPPLENEDNIMYAEELGFRVVAVSIPNASGGLVEKYRDSVIRFYPHVHDTPGFFIARLVKPG
ncbi:MAG: RsmB/NOP family class I SAM-dependent RNA methyltransferase [Vulcanisaeta sp.]|nr:RsmB/NOP family class I SAM-dependent RNA methyltransferase [Vulcanisaeta sp.]MCG2880313.1 RsmB/NOP family class I SAM-dependent RNA methyltransferase [Vulcanisaeta sp.]